MPNEENTNLNSGSNLVPVPGKPDWYYDPSTGQTVHESDLGSLLDEDILDDLEYEEDEDEYEQHERQDAKKEQNSEGPEENSSESTGEGADSQEGELGGEATPAEASLEEGAGEGLAEGGAEAVSEAVAEEAVLATEAEALAAETAATAAAETAAASATEAGAAATSEVWVPILAVIIIIIVLVSIIFLAFMAYGSEDATALTPSGAGIRDGDRDALAKEVLAHPNITTQDSVNVTDIDPDKCYTAAIGWEGEKCVQKPILQLLLALADAGFKVQISSTIRDHPPSINPSSKHLAGLAVDIGNDEIFLDAMKWMTSNILSTEIAPHQILCAGADNVYGAGKVIPAIDNLSVNKGKISPGFTSKYVGDHTNHIHIGY